MPIQTIYADTTGYDDYGYYITLPDGTRLHPTGEVRSYSLSDITEGHSMYEIANRIMQQQFGVQGDRSDLAGRASQVEHARRREEQRLWSRQELRADIIIVLAGVVVCLCVFGIKKLRLSGVTDIEANSSEDNSL